MVGCHHQFNGHEFEQALGDGEGQGSLVCCSPWDHKELDTIEQPNNNNKAFSNHLLNTWIKLIICVFLHGVDIEISS